MSERVDERVAVVDVRAFVWHDQCLEVDGTFAVTGYGPEGRACPYCASAVVVKLVGHAFDPGIARELSICEACGTISDTPVKGIAPVFDGPEVLERGRSHAYAVTVRNVRRTRPAAVTDPATGLFLFTTAGVPASPAVSFTGPAAQPFLASTSVPLVAPSVF